MADNNNNGYIKLYKKMLKWEWFDDINTMRLFIFCLLKANWESGSWHGIDYEPGEFITSLSSLSEQTGLTIQQTRTALSHLKSTGELTDKTYSNFRVITINNWSEYQGDNKASNRQSTSNQQGEQQGINKASTTDKEYKEDKNININNKYMCAFDEFWQSYPRKVEKAKAYKQYLARLKDGYSEEQLLTACKNYAKVCELNHTEQRYIKHGATFLSVNEPFLDYLEMPKEETPEKPIVRSRTSGFEQPEKSAAYGKIHNYEEREIDYEALEREFFGN